MPRRRPPHDEYDRPRQRDERQRPDSRDRAVQRDRPDQRQRPDGYAAAPPPRFSAESGPPTQRLEPIGADGRRGGGRPPNHPAPTPRRPRPTPLVLAGRSLLGFACAATLIASGVVWSEYKNLTDGMHQTDAVNLIKPGEQGYVPSSLNGDVNLLLIGLDSRKDMNGNDLPTSFVESQLHAGSSGIGGYNTNVLILLHIPANGGQVTGFSIPRDDYVEEPGGPGTDVGDVPDLGKHKLKEAYGRAKVYAERTLKARGIKDKAVLEAKSREVGRESTTRAVQLLTGVKVDHIAEVNLLGFYDIAKAVGPIEVCLNHPVNDPIMDGAGTGLKLPAGHSVLDAAQSLQFVRQRFHLANGDLDRNRRQQAFLSSVMHTLRSKGVVGDLGKVSSLFNVVKNDLVIDDNWDIINFGMAASNLTGGNAVINELPITGQPVLPEDGSVNTVDPVAIKRIVTTAFANDSVTGPGASPPPSAASAADASASISDAASLPDSAPAPSSAAPANGASTGTPTASTRTKSASAPLNTTIDIFNATKTKGLATTAANVLTTSGWPINKTANSPGTQPKTTILYGNGAEDAAKQLAAKLGLAATPTMSRNVQADHVSVYLGADYVTADAGGSNAGVDGGVAAQDSAPGDVPSDNASAPAGKGDPNASATFDGPSPVGGGINMNAGITCVN